MHVPPIVRARGLAIVGDGTQAYASPLGFTLFQ